jgi:hypothetical protein
MGKVYINPPPADKKCQRCSKHIDELKPFGKAGDPLVGDFEGAKLVKTFRCMVEEDIPEFDNILSYMAEKADSRGWENAEYMAEQEFGKDRVEQAMFYDQLRSTVEASWECRDCIIL